MIRFDEVLPETVKIVEACAFATDIISVTVIRDLQGRVRLMLEFPQDWQAPANWGAQKQTLETALEAALSSYWGGKIWRTGSRRDVAFRAMEQTIHDKRLPWPSAPGTSGRFDWYKLERLFSKSSWQANTVAPPWSIDAPDKPAIIAFYSFKGGVGRTTTTAAIALLLARAGKRVLVLDLDLEAPGIGPLLLENIPPSDNGIVDYLVEWQLLNRRPANLNLYVTIQNQQELVGLGQPLRIMTAGKLDIHFLEKLARLDFENFVNQETNPLVELLHHADDEYNLDFILLDLRSGLHDLGGLSLNGLSHLDILFGLDTEQSWAGLELVLDMGSLGLSVHAP